MAHFHYAMCTCELRQGLSQLIGMFRQADRDAHKIAQVRSVKVAQQDAMRLNLRPYLRHRHILMVDMSENIVTLRREWFQEWVRGEHRKEAFPLLHNLLNLSKRVVKLLQRLNGSNMSGDIDLEGALSASHIGHDPLGEKAIADT